MTYEPVNLIPFLLFIKTFKNMAKSEIRKISNNPNPQNNPFERESECGQKIRRSAIPSSFAVKIKYQQDSWKKINS